MLKVLIVEDEAGIQSSIAAAYSWEELGCEILGLAGNGIEALEICLSKPPDIIITDIVMPGIDGLTFLKYVKDKHPGIRCIVLTAHRNFEHAQTALNIGASYYLLKPINYTELKEQVRTLAQSILEEKEEKQLETSQELLFRDLIRGRLYRTDSLPSPLRRFFDQGTAYRIGTMRFDGEQVDDLFLSQGLYSLCSDLLSSAGDFGWIIRVDNVYLSFLLPTHGSDALGDTRALFSQIQERVCELLHKTVSVGISAVQCGPQQVRLAYAQSIKALNKKFFAGNQSINIYWETDEQRNPAAASQNIMETVNSLAGALDTQPLPELTAHVEDAFWSLIESCSQRIDAIRSTLIIVLTLSMKKITKNDYRQFAQLLDKYALFSKVVRCDTLEDLRDLFTGLMLDLRDYASAHDNQRYERIDKVMEYICEHYSEPISLPEIAQTVYMSPPYLSSLISMHTGRGFAEIVNDIRIQKAAELLRTTDKRIVEIAALVGFRESQYFSSVFKKHFGLTPRDYREQAAGEFLYSE